MLFHTFALYSESFFQFFRFFQIFFFFFSLSASESAVFTFRSRYTHEHLASRP